MGTGEASRAGSGVDRGRLGRSDLSMATETLPEPVEVTEGKIEEAFEKSWNVIVWNDPVNLMSYVVFVFMKVLGFTKEKATRHMLEVHEKGKSLVATETREKAELYFQQLQNFGLTVTLEQFDA
jgi:ATP-dependent Clp protease adaptor protein ClpS